MSCLHALKANNWQRYNAATSGFEFESWRHTTLWIAPCHREHGIAHGVGTALAMSVYTKIPHNNLRWSNTWIFFTSEMHSAWSCAHSRMETHSSKLWPYTGNLAKVGDGHSFVSGCFFMRLQYLLYKYHHSTKLHWKISWVCCRLYCYKCAAWVTMPTATNKRYFFSCSLVLWWYWFYHMNLWFHCVFRCSVRDF